MGLKKEGRVFANAANFPTMPFAPASPANQRTPCCGHTSGAWLNASAPPARIRSETPSRM